MDVLKKPFGAHAVLPDMRSFVWRFFFGVSGLVLSGLLSSDPIFAATTQPAITQISFRRDVVPLLLKQCQDCHGVKKSKGGYRLDTFEHLNQSGDSDAIPVVPGKPKKSELFRLISTHDEDEQMPKKAERLPEAQIAILQHWIEQGASFDGSSPTAPLASMVTNVEHPAPPEVYHQPIPITAISFNPEGSELAISGYHEITLWNPEDGKLIGRIKKLPERTYSLCYSPDGKTLAAATGNPGSLGEVRLMDAFSRDAGKVIERMTDVMLVVRFNPDGSRLAAGGADNSIRIYNTASQKREQLIEQHGDWVNDLAFSPDGLKLVSASRDKSARVFDVNTGAMQAAYLGHEESVLGVTWNPDGKLIYTAGHDRKIHAWNPLDDKKKVSEIAGFPSDPFKMETGMGCLFCPAADGIVRQYTLDKLTSVRPYLAGKEWAYCLSLDTKHRRLAVGYGDGKVRLWDVDQGKPLTEFIAAPGYLHQ